MSYTNILCYTNVLSKQESSYCNFGSPVSYVLQFARLFYGSPLNIGDIHYYKENKTNGGKQIEFSAESNQFEKKIKSGNK